MTIVPAKITSIENLQNEIYVSSMNESTNGSCIYVPLSSGQVVSKDKLITNGSGQNFFWNLTLPQGSVINTPNSNIQYEVKFKFNCIQNAVAANAHYQAFDELSGTDLTGNNNVKEYKYLPPGRFKVIDNILWCSRADVGAAASACNATTEITSFEDKWTPICLFPMNSANILNQSTVYYGSTSQTDDNIYMHRTLLQNQLSEEYQAMQPTQFFDQDIDAVMEFCNLEQTEPGKWELPGAGADANNPGTFDCEVTKTFTISLNMVNQMFDIKGKFYTSAFPRDTVRLDIKLQPYSIAKLFFTEKICNVAGTGIQSMKLNIYQKSSSTLPSEFMDKGQFILHYNKYTMDNLTLNGVYQDSTAYLSSGHNSTNDVYLTLSAPDTPLIDSCHLKQRFTLYSSEQIRQIMGGKIIDQRFCFFNNLNIERGGATYRYFTEDMVNPEMMRYETLRSCNALQQYDTSMAQSMNSLRKMMCKYAMVRINFEAFAGDNLNQDVIMDGYNSVMQKVLVKTKFRVYDMKKQTDEEVKLTVTDTTRKYCMCPYNYLNLFAFQMYDNMIKCNVQQGTMTISEDM